jgi:hypothetical protein
MEAVQPQKAAFDFEAWSKAEGWSDGWMPLPKPSPSPFASAERVAQIALRHVEGAALTIIN